MPALRMFSFGRVKMESISNLNLYFQVAEGQSEKGQCVMTNALMAIIGSRGHGHSESQALLLMGGNLEPTDNMEKVVVIRESILGSGVLETM